MFCHGDHDVSRVGAACRAAVCLTHEGARMKRRARQKWEISAIVSDFGTNAAGGKAFDVSARMQT